MRIFTILFLSLNIISCSTQVKVSSTPSGVKVSEAIKGDLGITPTSMSFSSSACEKILDSCYLSFYFSKPGYESQRIERIVGGTGSSLIFGEDLLVHAYLKEIKTELTVRGFPVFANHNISYQKDDNSWHELALTGKNGTIPSLLDEEPWQGKDYCMIKLNFESPGYFPTENIITIKRGQKKHFEYVLEEYSIFGSIDSAPQGADVYERNLGYLGRTPFQINIPYDQLVRISPQRKNKLNEPIQLFLKFSKPGFKDLEKISSIGEIDEMEEPDDFSISDKLIHVNQE
mgnify:CR=1 FL=1